jgi:hypothetical protein
MTADKTVSWYLYGLALAAVLTAISPMFIISWPYLAVATWPTIRWSRRFKSPLGRGILSWIVLVAFLMTALWLSPLVWAVATGYSGSETWWYLCLTLFFGLFLVAAVIVTRRNWRGPPVLDHEHRSSGG